jgi:hypothetical protein
MKTIAALALALAFTAPIAASASSLTVAQKVQQTYHTQFDLPNQAQAGAGSR